MRTEKQDQFYTVKTLAEKLAIKPITVYRMVDQGKLPAVRIGKSIRFKPADIDAFLESVRVGPAGLIEDEVMKEENHEKRKSRKSNPGQN
jgi:excisionase family DNA binding protein